MTMGHNDITNIKFERRILKLARKVRCPICEEKRMFQDRSFLITHIDKYHHDSIPEGWDASRYENFLRTGKETGKCIICGGPTEWIPETRKYRRHCGSAKCRAAIAQNCENNMVRATGKTRSERMKDPEVQRKMVYSKKTSGCYKIGNHEIWYDSTYGEDFCKVCDKFLALDMKDIFGPSPNTYEYDYGGKHHMYIPDFYLSIFNLEVEIKDGGDNPNMHPKIQSVDKKKESIKDRIMGSYQKAGIVNYIKIVNKDYTDFFKLIMDLREEYDGDTPKSKLPPLIQVATTEGFLDVAMTGASILSGLKDTNVPFQITRAKGRSGNYSQIPKFYMEKMKNMDSSDIAIWESQMTRVLEILKQQRQEYIDGGDYVPYELDRAINEMENRVIPEFNNRKAKIMRNRDQK